jgi:hypothetical protein
MDYYSRLKSVLLEMAGQMMDEDVLAWGEVILATGSTCANGTIVSFVDKKPVVFYGVTVAGPAKVYGYQRFCPIPKRIPGKGREAEFSRPNIF